MGQGQDQANEALTSSGQPRQGEQVALEETYVRLDALRPAAQGCSYELYPQTKKLTACRAEIPPDKPHLRTTECVSMAKADGALSYQL